MATQQDYSTLGSFYNGNALTQVTSIQHVTNSGNQRVDLLNEGLGGFSPGSGDCTIEIGFAIPIGGTEAPFQQDCAQRKFVTLQITGIDGDYIGEGKIDTVTVNRDVGSPTAGSFTWTGELAAVE